MNNDNNNNFQPQSQPEPQPQVQPDVQSDTAPQTVPPVAPAAQPFASAQPTTSFQSAPAANFSQPQVTPTPDFGATPPQPVVNDMPVQPDVQPATQPMPRKKGAPLWMWIALGVVVLLVAGAIAAVLLIK